MERILSDEEKIKKAIEISQRRKNQNYYSKVAKINLENPKREYKLFKRTTIQILVCLIIYSLFYLIFSNNYIFSSEVVNKISSVLNYDINFYKIYNNGKNKINEFIEGFNKNKEDKGKKEEIEKQKENNIVENVNSIESNNIAELKEETVKLSQMEKDVIQIKNICNFQIPLEGKITSKFGEREITSPVMSANHKGIDIAAEEGEKIKSAIDGQVEEADNNSDYGNYIKIKQGEVVTVYAHCKKLKVSKGDKIKKGDIIATVGSTGKSTGPHLHFEIRLSNRYINPELIINF